jgi:hypothetical protein
VLLSILGFLLSLVEKKKKKKRRRRRKKMKLSSPFLIRYREKSMVGVPKLFLKLEELF